MSRPRCWPALPLGSSAPATASTWLPGGYDANTAGGKNANNLLGTISGPYDTNQFGFSSAILSQGTAAVPIGAIITGIALPQAPSTSANSQAYVFGSISRSASRRSLPDRSAAPSPPTKAATRSWRDRAC